MAIAFDASTTPWARVDLTTTMTVSHTCTGSNRFIVVNVGSNSTVLWVTYAWVSLTQIQGYSTDGAGNSASCWGLANPASGANNVVITTSGTATIMCEIASYTWVAQSSPVDVSVMNWPTTTTSFTQTVTTTVDNDWLIMCGKGRSGATVTAGANTFVRVSIETLFTGLFIADSNSAQTPVGSKSLNVTSASQEFNGIMFALKPFTASVSNSAFFMFL